MDQFCHTAGNWATSGLVVFLLSLRADQVLGFERKQLPSSACSAHGNGCSGNSKVAGLPEPSESGRNDLLFHTYFPSP